MTTEGPAWLAACTAVGAVWVLAASWRAEAGTVPAALRGLLGGLAALGTASILYQLMQSVGLDIRWGWIEKDAWPALGFAALVGLVEETAKLAGIAVALPGPRNGGNALGLLRTTVAVAAVFAIAEALFSLRGGSWPVALSRAVLGPVAHGVLAAPFAVVLANAAGVPRARFAARLATGLVLAALLHGFGDWSLARNAYGRVGFAVALLAPTFWLYARARVHAAEVRR
ncbi:MAG TPA: PrsW family glutamic-type intramembrane protease [Anaeromyxobacteraceae bacterium]|nr:PrsW family glutamic-type intramembrane protease [Anaeromyxobacteraceae bacterium]